ncbi:LINE-1 reverse transcriptase isogeny [Gossypium australe]|uniref:LINE-1 reverse transcriptase isogeny n=1 Tax=Gossypium australe TaxID=47621 RepID=A0A5B6VBE3_9ROSI|nr:LINE-1 reverse transcriptase isogeny [Gossypium australe]
MEAFHETLEECQLEDIGYSGVWFTWEKGNFAETNIKERLDRGVAIEKWKILFPTGNIHHLTHSTSEHCPLLLNTKSGNIYAGNPQFKFEALWTIEESLEKEIKAFWESNTGTMEKLQENLKEWAGSIKKRREGLKKKLTKELEMLMAKERDDDTIAKIIDTKEWGLSALKGMGPTKAPGPDGFPTLFFQRYWHIVDIVLILKTQNPTNLANFRPISLCKVLYKIVAKTIANRFQAVIGRCIDTAQSAFVPGRLISDNVLLAHEILHTFRQKRTGEGLSALMRLAMKEGLRKGAKASRRGPVISHLLFADDCILFEEATNKGARLLKGILKEYEECSSQCVNFNKSTIFYSSNTSEGNKGEISAILGVRLSTDMEKYLGLPNVVGRLAKILCIPLAKEPHDDILAWSGEPSGEFTRIHEKASKSGKEIENFINSYILELNGIEEKIPKILPEVKRWKHPPSQFMKINFDAAYDGNICQSAVGIVARDSEGIVLLSYSEIHQQLASAFIAEAITCRTVTQIGIDMQCPKLIF